MGLEKLFLKIDSACDSFEVNWPDLQGNFLIMCSSPLMFQTGQDFLWVHRGHRGSGPRSLLLQRGQLEHGMQFINYPLPYNCGDKLVHLRLSIRSENDRSHIRETNLNSERLSLWNSHTELMRWNSWGPWEEINAFVEVNDINDWELVCDYSG